MDMDKGLSVKTQLKLVSERQMIGTCFQPVGECSMLQL